MLVEVIAVGNQINNKIYDEWYEGSPESVVIGLDSEIMLDRINVPIHIIKKYNPKKVILGYTK